MAWNPANEIERRATGQAPHWQQIQSIYDEAVSLASLPRSDWDYLKANYIHERRGERSVNLAEAATALPAQFATLSLGASEIDFLDFILNYSRNRVLTLIAPRGAGKTSFLHYVEAAIDKARLGRRKPVFLIFGNLEKLEDSTGQLEDDCRELLVVMAAEAERRAAQLSEPWRKALGDLGLQLRQCNSLSEARECFRSLTQGLSKREVQRLVVVFDNLDQLETRIIALVVELARVIYLVSQVTCIVCLRPNCFLGVAQRGDARAFFNYEISLRSPDVSAWIGRLGQRMAVQAAIKASKDQTPLIIAGRTLTPEQLGNAMDRFAALLSYRRPQDDALGLLQALCADDVRHLRILVRRLLRHRSFPLLPLLDGDSRIDYHPLPALLDGPNVLYRHDNWVPNLLRWSDPQGSTDFLILHRLLRLLDRGTPETLESLLSHMELLNYSRDTTLSALETLSGPLLVRGTDKDKFNSASPPSALYLTEAGEYYLRTLLCNGDYLLAAVLDVPLRHEKVQRSFDRDPERPVQSRMFLERLDSLVEYMEEVGKREKDQIFRLGIGPTVSAARRVADSMRYDGLMLSSLCRGIEAVIDRSWYTRYGDVWAGIEEYRPRILAVRETESLIRTRLEDIVRRREKTNRVFATVENQQYGPMNLSVKEFGEELAADAQIRLASPNDTAVLLLELKQNERRTLRTAVARPTAEVFSQSEDRVVRAVGRFAPLPRRHDGQIENVLVRAYVRESVKIREAFLAPELSDGKLKLRLHRLDPYEPPIELGDRVATDDISRTVQNILAEISGKVLAQTISRDDIHTAGTTLALQLMNVWGMNLMATIVPTLDRLVILSEESDIPVPYEWLRPTPQYEEDYPMSTLAEHCSVVRFPLNPIEYVVRARERTLYKAKLCTIGLPNDKRQSWRLPLPSQISQLRQLFQGHEVVHIVAHFDTSSDTVEVKDHRSTMVLSMNTIQAHPICGPEQSVVLTVCDNGSLERKRNFARILAECFGCAVWTPLVSIAISNAESLDLALEEYLRITHDRCSLDQFFLAQRLKEAFANVYIRFGV